MVRNPLTLTRQELYDLVWTHPMTTLAKEFNLSDVALAKRCRAVDVPVPPRGYWARKPSDQAALRTPLPKYRTRSSVVEAPKPSRPPPPIEIVRDGPEPIVELERRPPEKKDNFRRPEDDEWIAQRREFDGHPENVVEYSPSAARWHAALVGHRDTLRAAAKKLEKSRLANERYNALPESRRRGYSDLCMAGGDWRGAEHRGQRLIDSHKAIAFRLSTGCFERALAIANTLARAVEARGFQFEDDPGEGRLVVRGHGGRVPLRITEKLAEKIERVRRYDGSFESQKQRLPTGTLKLSLEITPWNTVDFVDRVGSPVEQQFAQILDALYKLVVRCRVERREAEHRRHEQQLAAQAWVRAEETRKEAERRRLAEAKRRRALVAEATRWQRSARIRAYVDHLEGLAAQIQRAPEELKGWCQWARKVADDVDPSMKRVALSPLAGDENHAGEPE